MFCFTAVCPKTPRASSRTEILIRKEWRHRVLSHDVIGGGFINLRIRIPAAYLTIICVYGPKEGKKEQNYVFYYLLQEHTNLPNKPDYFILDVRVVCTGFIWLRTATNGGLLRIRK
jgi:hypothetical protein